MSDELEKLHDYKDITLEKNKYLKDDKDTSNGENVTTAGDAPHIKYVISELPDDAQEHMGAMPEDAKDHNDTPPEDILEPNRLAEYEPKVFHQVEPLAELSRAELCLTLLCPVTILAIAAWYLYPISRMIERKPELSHYLADGWPIIGLKKDASSQELICWRAHVYDLVAIAIVHVVTSRVASLFGYQYRRHAWLVVGVASMIYLNSWQAVIFCAIIILTLFYVALSGSTLLTWAVAGVWLTLFNNDDWMEMVNEVVNESAGQDVMFAKYILFYISTAFFLLRIISFALEKAKRVNGTSELAPEITFTLYDAFVYGFYCPNLYTGPVFVYKYFQAEILKPYAPWTRKELFYLAHKTLRSVFWIFFLDIILHFMYIHLLAKYNVALNHIHPWALGGVFMYYVSLYQTSHVASYGSAGCVMLTDRIIPPSTPRCIARVSSYSGNWRHFDPGLHGFFRNYVYIPLGGSRHGPINQAFATAVTFMFVYYWHGARGYLAVWTASNCCTIIIEMFAKYLSQRPDVREFEASNMDPAMIRRFHAALNAPLWMFSNYSIMTFFTRGHNSWPYMKRLAIDGSAITWTVMLVMHYCYAILAQEVEQWEKQAQGQGKVKKE